ncbi:monovalent cation/H+ antiporter subunit A, partial [Thauera aminoaromatica]
GAMSGVVLSGNLIQIVLFWELTSLFSFLLIGYWHHRRDARRGARMALTVTGAGGLCLLAGMLVLGYIVGSYDLDVVLASGVQVRTHPLYTVVLVLVLLGALTKSAQFPFHFWLPHAMAAPTPVSAYLHSATMVKAGAFLMARLWPVLAGTDEWFWLVTSAGLATLLIGGFAAIFQHDLKGLLAYSTLSHLGLITTLLGLNSPLAAVAAVFHILNHATFKASLFMAVGIIDHETGTRDIRRLSGLRRAMPITATLACVASAAMAGVPLLNGFISKEMFFTEAVFVTATPLFERLLPIVATVAGMFSVVYSLRFTADVFFGPDTCATLPKRPHEPPHWMRVPIEVLVLACLLVGVAPQWAVQDILNAAAAPVVGGHLPAFDLAVWHGFNLPLAMSVCALVGGVALYGVLRRHFDLARRERVPLLHRLNGAQAYETTMLQLTRGAEWLLRRVGTRRLQPQLMLMMLALLLIPLLLAGAPPAWTVIPVRGFDPIFAGMWLIGAGCALAAAWMAKYHRLAALALVGGTGIVTAATFLWLSAPDLALTQLMVETVTTVLILLGLRWLPPRIESIAGPVQPPWQVWTRRARDLALAVGGGLALAALTHAVLVHPASDTIADFFLLNALGGGGGSNVVNVLLVDFRSFDTLGEITVLAIVALTVYALLRRFRPAPESAGIPPQQRFDGDPASRQSPGEQAGSGYLMVPGIYLRLLLPFMGVIAVYFFMRGHNLPGGGFVAGLIFAVAILVQYMLAGTVWVESRLNLRPHRWLGFGLLLACATGLGAWWFGHPFLTTHTAHVEWPLVGELHLPSAFVFDLGVFAVVVGTTMLMLVALAHQSLRAHRHPGEDLTADGQGGAEGRRI